MFVAAAGSARGVFDARVETFSSESDAKKRDDYVHAITSSSSLFAEYEYLHGTVLLRLSHYLTPSEAVGYERALKENQ